MPHPVFKCLSPKHARLTSIKRSKFGISIVVCVRKGCVHSTILTAIFGRKQREEKPMSASDSRIQMEPLESTPKTLERIRQRLDNIDASLVDIHATLLDIRHDGKREDHAGDTSSSRVQSAWNKDGSLRSAE